MNIILRRDGIYDGPDCSGPVNHEITLVGYGTSKELQIDYWVNL